MMNLEEAKAAVERAEKDLGNRAYVVAHVFERNSRELHLALTERLRKACRRGRVWKSKEFLATFKNGEKGYDPPERTVLAALMVSSSLHKATAHPTL